MLHTTKLHDIFIDYNKSFDNCYNHDSVLGGVIQKDQCEQIASLSRNAVLSYFF